MKETIFKVGDRVFVANYGWGIIDYVKRIHCCVKFDNEKNAVRVPNKLISFQEYTLNGFSQERPIDYEDYIGKWGIFYDEEQKKDLIYKFGKLQRIQHNNTYRFNPKDSIAYYEYFEPLTEEQIGILGLTNKNVDNEEHI